MWKTYAGYITSRVECAFFLLVRFGLFSSEKWVFAFVKASEEEQVASLAVQLVACVRTFTEAKR